MIKAIVMDVDGTLTDGKIYMSAQGEAMKAFDIKDGYAIHELLPAYNVKTVIMTGRKSEIVINRAKELEVDIVLQGVKDKKTEIINLSQSQGWSADEIAFIGDDVMDLAAMEYCGVSGCPNDASKSIREYVDYIAVANGGRGAVREFSEWLIEKGKVKK